MKKRFCIYFTLICTSTFAQVEMPKDFLSKEFHKDRRQKLREKMPPNSVAVFFANAVRNRSNDVDYIFHQDPNFYYLTGYKEPHAVLFIFKEKQTSASAGVFDELIFVQPRNEEAEMWNGRRLGDAGVRDRHGLNAAFNNTLFKGFDINFSKFDQVLFYDFENDVRNDPYDSADLYDLIQQFKVKANYPGVQKGLTVEIEPRKNNLNTTLLNTFMTELRGVKTPDEIAMIRRAVRISAIGQIEVMKAIKPGMSEREIQGIHEFVFKKYQAEDLGYPSIVGAGNNGCILHYEENYKPEVYSSEMILMDLGAEYHGYTADVTRTIPVSGKFSSEQKQIYEIVLKAQEEAMKVCKPGVTLSALTQVTKRIVNRGLFELGIIANENAAHQYYPHGCCHHIGLDVHDKGTGQMKEGMVITIEPGIYIPANAACDKKWWNIAVRIEDDFLLTANGNQPLSFAAPRTVAEIETLMAQPSELDDFNLPEIEKE